MDVEPRSSGGTPPHVSSAACSTDSHSTMCQESNQDVKDRLECVALSLEEETPPFRSLLCPAHWGALLESTTVSLVSTVRERAWDAEDAQRIERPAADAQQTTISLFERGARTPDSVSGNGDDSRTPQGGQSPQRYCAVQCR